MLALLSPRLLIALALVGVLAFTHLSAYNRGKTNVQREWDSATAQANIEAAKITQRRQSLADEAARIAATREARTRADAVNARAVAGGLRDDLRRAREYAAQSRAAAQRAADLTTELLERCTASYLSVAEDAQRADSEARELRQAWPR